MIKALFKIGGFLPYILIVFLNSMTDLGHKIVLQNTIFKAYEGTELIILDGDCEWFDFVAVYFSFLSRRVS